jgi:3-hydroxyisobutyrate dehydrogenase
MKITVLGTGLMGFPMAERLMMAGHEVTVYNRTMAKARPLKKKGARVMAAARDAVDQSGCIILTLTDVWAVEEVLSPQENRLLSGKTVIQMGTIAPSESLSLHGQVTRHGGHYLECPVLGSRKEAKEGGLILMAGGAEALFQEWKKVLRIFGRPRYIGEVGKAAALKLALNQLIASHAAAFSLSLGIVEKNKIDTDIFVDILKRGALYAPMFEKKLPHWRWRDYDDTNFPVKHLLKDVELIMREAKEKRLSTDVVKGVYNVLDKALAKGLGDKDYSAVFNVINNI